MNAVGEEGWNSGRGHSLSDALAGVMVWGEAAECGAAWVARHGILKREDGEAAQVR